MRIVANLLLFNTAFRLSYGTSRYRLVLTIHLELDGIDAFGSGVIYACSPSKAYKDINKVLLPVLQETKVGHICEMRERIANLFGQIDGGALYAADLLLWDLESKLTKRTISDLLNVGKIKRNKVMITEQIWAVKPKYLGRDLYPVLNRGTTQIKVKLYMGNDSGINFIKQIKAICGEKVIIKIDPNGQFTNFTVAENSLKSMEELGVSLVEDPLHPSFGFDKIRKLKNHLGHMKIMLDYNMSSITTIDKALDHDAFDVINIKLSRIGGITRALPLIKHCVDADKQVSIGCNEDIGPAMFGILHLSSVVLNHYGTEGVGWYRLNSKILKEEPKIVNGAVEIPTNNLGIQPYQNFNFTGKFLSEKILGNQSFKFISNSVIRRGRNYLSKINHKLTNS